MNLIMLENFENVLPSGIAYGGYNGSKKGIIFNKEKWFLKYPKFRKNKNVIETDCATSPISEYLGSNIYRLLGVKTHETKLGFTNEKIVVACKDFLNKNETILDYNSIKNDYDEVIEKELEELSSTSKNHPGTDLDEILIVMNNNSYFEKVPELRNLFWDMFIVDAFISNNDRNDNNWGLILNHDTMKLKVSPVYDNGASFYSKSSDEKIESILNDDFKMKQVVYDSSVSAFVKNGKIINPLKFIESMSNDECNQALLRIFPKIDLEKIKELIDNIPIEYNKVPVLSENQRELYYKSMVYKYEKVFKIVYELLLNLK